MQHAVRPDRWAPPHARVRVMRRLSLRRQLLVVLVGLTLPLLVSGASGGLLLQSADAGHERSVERVRVSAGISALQARVAGLSAGLTTPELLAGRPVALLRLLGDTAEVERGFTALRAQVRPPDRPALDLAYADWRRMVDALVELPPRLPLDRDAAGLSSTLNDLGPRIMQVARELAQVAQDNARVLSADLEAEHRQQERGIQQLLALAGTGLVGAVLASRWLHRRIAGPLLGLRRAAERLGTDDLDERVERDATPEFGALADAFNLMADQLQDSRRLLVAREERFRALVQHSSDLVAVVDPAGLVTYITPSAEHVLGLPDSALTGTRLLDRVHDEDRDLVAGALASATRSAGTGPIACRLRVDAGPTAGWCQVELVVDDLSDDPAVAGLVVTARDVSVQTRLHEQLRHHAFHDELTGLANRVLFTDRLTRALAPPEQAARDGAGTAVLYCDLDEFQALNDTLGLTAGDVVLATVGHRISAAVRSQDTSARLGGDEFAVLLEDVTAEQAREAAERLLLAVRVPLLVDDAEVTPRMSIGLVLARSGHSCAELLREAGTALAQAKRNGKGEVAVYDPQVGDDLVARLELTADLRRALRQGEFLLHYQPTVDLGTGVITGVEALVRWQHPVRGMVPPSDFIALAEASGVIGQLGLWVLRTACAQARAWQLAQPSHPLRMAVNLSGRQLEDDEVVGQVAQVLAETGLDPALLTLELTESILVDRSDDVLRRLHELRALGLKLAIDDFGTGYSSLSYLQRLPVDVLKIDKSFVDVLVTSGRSDALAGTIVSLAHTLGLGCIAEGIEHADQVATLLELGCQVGQGYLFSRPVPAARLQELLLSPGRLGPLPLPAGVA